MHCYLVGVQDTAGVLGSFHLPVEYEKDLLRLGGAIGRATLMKELDQLGYALRLKTGPEQRYFEIKGVPEELVQKANVWEHAPHCECGVIGRPRGQASIHNSPWPDPEHYL